MEEIEASLSTQILKVHTQCTERCVCERESVCVCVYTLHTHWHTHAYSYKHTSYEHETFLPPLPVPGAEALSRNLLYSLRQENDELSEEVTRLQSDVVQLQQHITFLQAMRLHNKAKGPKDQQ
jgi:hypothetical protein